MKKIEPQKKRVLVIGDLHEPFTLPGYLQFCKDTKKKYKCNEVVMIGDVIDNHHASFHDTDPDGMGGADELELAVSKIKKWAKAFPVAKVCIGNHDAIIMRKAFSSKIPKIWVKDYNDVLGTPGWDWGHNHTIDGVKYTHGTAGKADKRAVSNMESTVCGHYHTEAYTKIHVGYNHKVFSMQVGSGIDHESYAMAYAKEGKKPVISCGVVLEGELPLVVPMDLSKYK